MRFSRRHARSIRLRSTSHRSISKRFFGRQSMTDMLWHKSWLETRWRFLIGVALALCSAAATVLIYPRVLELVPLVPTGGTGQIGEQIREAARLTRDYRSY